MTTVWQRQCRVIFSFVFVRRHAETAEDAKLSSQENVKQLINIIRKGDVRSVELWLETHNSLTEHVCLPVLI